MAVGSQQGTLVQDLVRAFWCTLNASLKNVYLTENSFRSFLFPTLKCANQTSLQLSIQFIYCTAHSYFNITTKHPDALAFCVRVDKVYCIRCHSRTAASTSPSFQQRRSPKRSFSSTKSFDTVLFEKWNGAPCHPPWARSVRRQEYRSVPRWMKKSLC
jgi:hypothetical protein